MQRQKGEFFPTPATILQVSSKILQSHVGFRVLKNGGNGGGPSLGHYYRFNSPPQSLTPADNHSYPSTAIFSTTVTYILPTQAPAKIYFKPLYADPKNGKRWRWLRVPYVQ